MRIVFMGTPDFAVAALDALITAGHEITAVFTQPDKPRGRGHKVSFSPVKEYAVGKDITVYQPLSLKKEKDNGESLEIIKDLNPDVIIVAAYGQILPKEILEAPRYGCVNIHASLLPRWRGASPINLCIISGDKKSGVTIMQMGEGLDTGDMLLSEECEIPDDMNAAELHDILKEIGAKLIVKFAENPVEYINRKTAQNNEYATYAPLITKEMMRMDSSKSARELYNLVRGLSGMAYMFYGDKRLKVFSSKITEQTESGQLDIICGDGKVLRLLEVRPEGKKIMSGEEFLRGRRDN